MKKKEHILIDGIEYKHCYRCNKNLLLNMFNKSSGARDGLNYMCIICKKEYKKASYQKQKEIISQRRKENTDYHLEYLKRKESYNKNPEKREKYLENKRIGNRKYRIKNKEKCQAYAKSRREESNRKEVQRRKNNEHIRIAHNLRSRINIALKTNIITPLNKIKKANNTEKLLGCSFEELKIYLQSLFTEGMSWENYGINGWHIDHIKPCASFNLENEKEQYECFNYKNLQPLWAKDNLIKSSHYLF